MDFTETITKLTAPFSWKDIEWRLGRVLPGNDMMGTALPFVTNRAIQTRLDSIFGPFGWRNEYQQWRGASQLCGISIYVERENGKGEWVTKWDGAEDTHVEPIKGGLSDSMKRAAVQWGIGRYLYEVEWKKHPVRQAGTSSQNKPQYALDLRGGIPQLPDWALPENERGKPQGHYAQRAANPPEQPPAQQQAAPANRTAQPPAQPPKPANPPPAAQPPAAQPPAQPPKPTTPPAAPPAAGLPRPNDATGKPAAPPAQSSVFDKMGKPASETEQKYNVTREEWGAYPVKNKQGEWTVSTAPDNVLDFYGKVYSGRDSTIRRYALLEIEWRHEEAARIAAEAVKRQQDQYAENPDDEIPF